ncbi:MAG TPA: hypothetical protein VFJ72_09370 [Rubrobacteraceae bacterium]|nr:hypothetical protein [Rubrobacteraceae bacterium]
MLLVTNGDIAVDRIEQAGIGGELLPWRDVLHEGPIPSDLPLDKMREVRARYIAEQGWDDFEAVIGDFTRRDATLDGFRDHEEVVLWFEHDLYDQLQLIQLLDWFSRRDLGATRLSMICVAEYLGNSEPDRLRTLFEDRDEVSARALDLGHEAWRAFTSTDPTRISTLLREGTSALPFLKSAMLRHLQQFPSTKNGLSRSETQALEAISEGRIVLHEAFASSQELEERIFLGDTVFAGYLEGLSRGNEPLVLLEDGGMIEAPGTTGSAADFWNRRAIVTDTGRAVLQGQKDWIEINGIDRWLGGVHLSGSEAEWRWDEPTQQLQRTAA